MNLALFDPGQHPAQRRQRFRVVAIPHSHRRAGPRTVPRRKTSSSTNITKPGRWTSTSSSDFQLKPLSRHARKDAGRMAPAFMRESVLPMVTQPRARPGLNCHLAAGDVCAIITATNSFRHRADRARIRCRTPDRHRAGAQGRRIHRMLRMCRVSAKARSPAPENWLSSRGWTLDTSPTARSTAIR